MKGLGKIRALPLYIFLTVILIIPAGELRSEESDDSGRVEFNTIWEMIKVNSPANKAAAADSKAAEIMKNRRGRHWFPRVYAEGRGYFTNDPGLTFMSNMGQRSVAAEDFIPDTLNEPGTNYYQRGVIGIDIPLYEGGAGVEGARAAAKIAEAGKYKMNAVFLGEFSSSAVAYGRIIVLMRTGNELDFLHKRVSAVLGKYHGSLKANPVEYSGILGLRALKNRVEALITENEAKIESLKGFLVKMSGNGLSPDWAPSDNDAVVFAETYLKTGPGTDREGSYMVRAYESLAESAKSRAEAGKAVFLPRVGVFGEGNLYNGDRDTADSYSAGFYIRMNILSPTEYGSVKQARLESDAARSKARDARLKEEIELGKLLRFSDALRSNIKILKESSSLMDEQIRNSMRLYSSGALRSFQLAEVFSRKADLVVNLASAEEEYINVRGGIFNYSGRADGEVRYDR